MKEVRIQQNGWKIRMQPLLVCFILTISVSISNFTSAQTWSLSQCIDTALQNNLDLKQAQISAQINATQLKNSKQHLLPTLNGGVSHGYNWGQTIDLFTNQFATQRVMFDNFYLSSSVVLFQGLRNYYTIKSNQLSLRESRLQREITARNIKIDVTAAYLQVLLNKRIVEISIQNQKNTQRQLDIVKMLKETHQATQNDLGEIKAQLAMDNYQVVKAKNDLHYSKMLLKQIINVQTKDSITFSDKLSIRSLTNLTTTINIDSLPEILKKDIAIKNQKYAIKIAKSNFYPSLTLSGSIGTGYSGNDQYFDNSGNPHTTSFWQQINNNLYQSVVLTLSIPIFNRNSSKNQVTVSKLKLKSLTIEKIKTIKNLQKKIEEIKMKVSSLNAQVESLIILVNATKNTYDNFLIRYKNGQITYKTLQDEKMKLYNAKSQLIEAKCKMKFNRIVLNFYSSN